MIFCCNNPRVAYVVDIACFLFYPEYSSNTIFIPITPILTKAIGVCHNITKYAAVMPLGGSVQDTCAGLVLDMNHTCVSD